MKVLGGGISGQVTGGVRAVVVVLFDDLRQCRVCRGLFWVKPEEMGVFATLDRIFGAATRVGGVTY